MGPSPIALLRAWLAIHTCMAGALNGSQSMSHQSIGSSWTQASSGGCPKHPTWPANPQFVLEVQADGPVNISLRCACVPRLPIGYVVLRQSSRDEGGRKTSSKLRKDELVFKTTWKNPSPFQSFP